jgi:N-acetylglutamate synthase-like GNAT family acetyltransferase
MKREHLSDIMIHNAKQYELSDILALLDECELPKEGLEAHVSTTLVARIGNEIVGCSALELYDESALLRSVAVKPSYRRRGLGQHLTQATLDLARRHKIPNVYLLTETASTFFSRLGFKPIPRSNVPEEVQRSVEYTTLCPETATVMTMPLVSKNNRNPSSQN